MTIMERDVPGVGTTVSVLCQISELCGKIKEANGTCNRVHERLSEILKELQKMEANNQLPPTDASSQYTEALHKSHACFEKYAHKSFVSRVLSQQAMMDEIWLLHEEIDVLMKILDIPTNRAMMQWKEEWEREREALVKLPGRLVDHIDLLLSELHSQKEIQEAADQLQSKLQQPDTSAEMRESAKKMLDAIIRTSGAKIPALPKWFIPQENLKYDSQPFAQGLFGPLHRGTWGSGTRVVVKTMLLLDGMHQHDEDAMYDRFLQEVEVWFELNHPHIVKMYGACHIATPRFIVCEDTTNGNLASYLQREGLGSMWKLLYQSALGLEYLHANQVVHGDLKLTNLLVGADGAARVSGFGMYPARRPSEAARSHEALEQVSKGSDGGGLRRREPHRATFASDVYSFAICIIEVVSGRDGKSVAKMIRNGEVLSQPSECPDEAWRLIVSMTARDPSERAKLEDVIKALKSLMDDCESSRVIDTQPVTTDVQPRESLSPLMRSLSVSSLYQKLDSTDDNERSAALEEVASRVTNAVETLPRAMKRGVDKWVDELKHTSTTDDILPRCKILNEIADVSEIHHGTIIQAGGVPMLAKLSRDESIDKDAKAVASSILKCLMNQSYRVHVVDELLKMVQPTEPESERLDGLRGIELCVSTEALSSLMSSDGVSELLTTLIQSGTIHEKERAVSILHKIATTKDLYLDSIRDAGGIDVLNSIAQVGESPYQAKAVWTLGAITRRSSIARQHPANLSIVPVLVEMARNGDEKKKESAAFALGSLMKSDSMNEAVRREGGVDVLHTLAKSGSPEQVMYAQRAIGIGSGCSVS